MDWFLNILTITPWWELLLILGFKIIEVTIATLRMIFINKGYRKLGVISAAIEIVLWLVLASTVINGLNESPMKGVSYGIGFAVGVYFGSVIEEKLAFGKVLIQTVIPIKTGEIVAAALRQSSFGVTELRGKGREQESTVLLILANRRDIGLAVHIIKDIEPEAMIVSSETFNISGGFTQNIRHLFK